MKRRIGALLTAAALVLSLLTTAALAAGTTLTVKTPETIPKAGEEFTVTVELSGNPGFCSVGFAVAFDHSKMTCKTIRAGALLAGVLSASNPNATEGAKLGAASAEEINGDGTLATLTFQAKEDLSSIDITLVNAKLSDGNGRAIYRSEDAESSAGADSTAQTAPSGGGTSSGTGTAAQTPSSGGATAETPTPSFPDAVGHWGEAWIVKAAERGLFSGDDKGSFRPDDNISRGDFVLVLWRMAGKPEPKAAAPFADVPENAYYAKAVAWAAEQGYVNGKGSGFAPKDSLTRQEAMKILFGYAGGVEGMQLVISYYDGMIADSGEIASWAKSAMYWAYSKAIISGTGANKLSPTATATRAQLAKILVGYQDMNT